MHFTHIQNGRAQQVDITDKPVAYRRALAEGTIQLKSETVDAIKQGSIEKGNVLNAATVAAVLATKQTAYIIPFCHPIPLTSIRVDYSVLNEAIKVKVEVKSEGKTGAEMEALTGVSVALLTIWDMVKSVEKDATGNYPTMKLNDIRVVHKSKIER
jgi:cyclic pyranopterin phosphate synthase